MSTLDRFPLSTDGFGKLYEEYYSRLCIIAFEYTRDKTLAEEMVEETFLALWEKRETINITSSIQSYLIRSTQNTCLQYIRKKKLKTQSLDTDFAWMHIPWGDDYPLDRLLEKELTGMVDQAIEALPPQCRKIFLLSRDQEMTYPQIAQTLGISENTVKTQIKTALLRLRTSLKDYLTIILWWLLQY